MAFHCISYLFNKIFQRAHAVSRFFWIDRISVDRVFFLALIFRIYVYRYKKCRVGDVPERG